MKKTLLALALVSVGLGAGYIVGSATGLGLGALLVGALAKLRRK